MESARLPAGRQPHHWNPDGAESHFLDPEGRGFASGDGASTGSVEAKVKRAPAERCSFVIYRADHVARTSTLLSGGDWRWRLNAADGRTLAKAGGYFSQEDCLRAVHALQGEAGCAAIAAPGGFAA